MPRLTAAQIKRREQAYESIARLERTLAQGDNRYGAYGRECYAALKRHQDVIDEVNAIENNEPWCPICGRKNCTDCDRILEEYQP